jgi:hypothetical protein
MDVNPNLAKTGCELVDDLGDLFVVTELNDALEIGQSSTWPFTMMATRSR